MALIIISNSGWSPQSTTLIFEKYFFKFSVFCLVLLLTIILEDDKLFRKEGQSVRIPLGAKHRAWNETDKDVIFIEVQTGTYFGEDDIVRFEDLYGR